MLKELSVFCVFAILVVSFFFLSKTNNHIYKVIPDIEKQKHDPGPVLGKYIGEEFCSIHVFNKQTKDDDKEISNKFLRLKKECFSYRITEQECMTEKFGIILASCNKKSDIKSYNKK